MNIMMLAGAFSAIVIFEGFSYRLMHDLKSVNIDTQYGHFQVAKKAFWDRSLNVSKKNKMISDGDSLVAALAKLENIKYVSGRQQFYGLISGGELTTNAVIVAFDESKEKSTLSAYRIDKGTTLSGAENEVIIGHGLYKQVELPLGQDLTVLTNTADGVVNAADLKLV